MKKYFNLLMMALFATMALSFASCSDDDEPEDPNTDNAEFIFDGKKMFLRNSGKLSYVRLENIMQIQFSLYKSQNSFSNDNLDLYPLAGADFEIKPFDVNHTSKGTKLEVVTSRYTWVSYCPDETYFDPMGLYGWERYFEPKTGDITFESYNGTKEEVTINVNLTMSNKKGESVTLKGKVNCKYFDSPTGNGLSMWGGEYDY